MPTPTDPLTFFGELYDRYRQSGIEEPAATALATATPEGRPSVRIVLLKEFSPGGFVFYTNLTSRKSRELQLNPHAALCFYWEAIHYQIRVEGRVEQVFDGEADTYFGTRPRGSQLGAWASRQSSLMPDRKVLQQRVEKYQERFQDKEVPRPEFWSGYRIIPEIIEFWHREQDRLHERTIYHKTEQGWKAGFLFP